MLNLKNYLKNNPYIIIGLFTISILLALMVVAPLLGSCHITSDFTESAKSEVRGIDIPNYIYISNLNLPIISSFTSVKPKVKSKIQTHPLKKKNLMPLALARKSKRERSFF